MKIFGIGLSRTGTTSLTEALSLLGFRTVHYPDLRPEISSGRLTLARFEPFDALTDSPIAAIYPQLVKLYPTCLFILTLRRKSDWLNSCERFFQFKDQSYSEDQRERARFFRLILYGTPVFSRPQFSYAWDRHLAEIARTIPRKRLLRMDVSRGDGWQRLCTVLSRQPPAVPFPHRHGSLPSHE